MLSVRIQDYKGTLEYPYYSIILFKPIKKSARISKDQHLTQDLHIYMVI